MSIFVFVGLAIGVSLITTVPVTAATNTTLNFQGRLVNTDGGAVVDGSYNMQFDLYSVSSGGTSLWTEDRLVASAQGVVVRNGHFSVRLGEFDAFPNINWDQELWLGMTVRGTGNCVWGSCLPADAEMTPRPKLTAVPYAFRAGAITDAGGVTYTADDLIKKSPSAVQTVNAAEAAIRLNQAGSGALIQMQGDGDDVFTVDKSGWAVFGAGLTIGNSSSTTAGTIRWSGTDLEVYDGSNWLSLTQGGSSGGGGGGGLTTTFSAYGINQGANSTTALNSLLPTGNTAVSFVLGGTAEIRMDRAGSFRACSIMNSAARTGGSVSVRFRRNGANTSTTNYCTINATNTRNNSQALDAGIETFSAGDTIGVALVSTGLAPTSLEHWVTFTVEYEDGASASFVHGGNEFGGTAVLGTNDNYGLNIRTNGVTAVSITSSGNTTFVNDVIIEDALSVGAGIDLNSSGVTEAGSITGLTSLEASGSLSILSGGGGDIVLDSGSDVVVLADSTLRRSASGTTTIDLLDAGGGTTLSILNSDGSQVAGLSVEGAVAAASFSGDGSGLTSLDGTAISSGTIADSRLSGNVALLDQNQSFSGLKTFASGLILGDSTATTAGAMRWNGSDFQGYNGIEWINLGGGGTPLLADQSTFYAYDAAGDIDITGGWTNITFDTEVKEDAPYSHAADSEVITFNQDGWYEVTFDIGTYVDTGSNRTSSRAKLQEDVGSGYTDIPGSQATMYNRNPANGYDSASVTILREFDAGDNIRLQAQSFNGTDTVFTDAETARIVIKRFVTSGSGGGGGMEFVQGGNDFAATAVIGTTGNNDLNFITNGSTALSLSAGNQAIFSGGILANGGVTIGNASSDGFTIVSDSVALTNGLTFDGGTFTIDSSSDSVGINTSTPTNRLNVNDADTADTAAQVLIATDADSNKGLVVQGSSGQSANLLEFQDSNGVVLGGFNANGGLVLGLSTITSAASGIQNISFGDESGTVCLSGSDACGFLPLAAGSYVIDSTNNDSIAINKTGASGSLIALQNNGGAVFTVSNTGALEIQNSGSSALDIRNVGGTSFFTVDTSTGVVRVGPAAADGNGVLFVVDTKNTPGDPSGVDGAIYYNSDIGRFRCREDGAWKDCIGTRQVRSFIDTTSDAVADNNTTNYWDLAVENNNSYPNITPATTTRSITGSVSFEVTSTTTADRSVVVRVVRNIGVTPSCTTGTEVGTILSTFTTNNGEQASNTMIFLDSPATTSTVYYTLCADSATSSAANMTINRVRISLEEANNSN